MWTLVVLFCSTAEPSQCAPSGPTTIFPTERSCVSYLEQSVGSINLDGRTMQYRCVGWGSPV